MAGPGDLETSVEAYSGQGEDSSTPFPFPSFSLIFLAGPMTEVQPAPGKRVRTLGAQTPSRVPLARVPPSALGPQLQPAWRWKEAKMRSLLVLSDWLAGGGGRSSDRMGRGER